jgi:Fungal fucose-specific lectin
VNKSMKLWTGLCLALPLLIGGAIAANAQSAVSWTDTAGFHLHVYSSNGTTVTEEALDPGGDWDAGTLSVSGSTVGATSWKDTGGQYHIRVYVSNATLTGSMITEYSNDGAGWSQGSLSVSGVVATATSWVDGSGVPHIRVYVKGSSLVEYCWDDGWGWPQGSFPG